MTPAALAVLATALLAAPPAPAAPPTWAGPLGVRTPGTWRELFLDVTGEDARALAAPALDLRWFLANDWSTPTVLVRGEQTVLLRNDEQAEVLSAAWRAPWGRGRPGERPFLSRLTTAVEGRLTLHWGGWTDGPIEFWHRNAGFTNFHRERWARGETHLLLRELGGPPVVDVHAATLALGDVVVRQQLLLAEGGASSRGAASAWALSARVDLKLPVGRLAAAGGSGGLDGAAALLGTVELAPWLTAHGLAALSGFSPLPATTPLQPRTWHTTWELSLVATWGAWAFLLEDRLASPLFADGWQPVVEDRRALAPSAAYGALRWHNQIGGGVRRGAVTVFFLEDFTPGASDGSTVRWFYNANAPDIVLGVSWRP